MSSQVLDRRGRDSVERDGAQPPRARGDGGGGFGRDGDGGLFADTRRVGLLAFMGTVTMLFLGFTSALMLRRASPDWQPLQAPSLLWGSSAALIASSLALQTARRRLAGFDLVGCERWTWLTGGLGVLFVTAQLGAWSQLAAQGVFLSSNPSSSFFYVLTGLHIVHLLGGFGWYGVVLSRLRRMAFAPGEDGLGLFATYWHFLGALWLYLLVLMFGF